MSVNRRAQAFSFRCSAGRRAFPSLDSKKMGLHLVSANTLPGVHLPALEAGDLLAFSGWDQSAQSFGASEDDWQAARRWTEHLRTVLAGKVF